MLECHWHSSAGLWGLLTLRVGLGLSLKWARASTAVSVEDSEDKPLNHVQEAFSTI